MLHRFIGEYVGAKSGNASVMVEKGTLTLTAGNSKLYLFPETNNRFFVKDSDITFEFISEKGKVAKMVIRENGEVVEESQIKK